MKKTLILASTALTLVMFASPTSADETNTIAENATADPQFSTLVAALTAADLVGPFDACNDAPLTVFAPTNVAFEAAFEALGVTAEEMLADKELLTSILTYHVVEGAVGAAIVVTLDSATTLNGADVSITVDGSSVKLNDTVNVIATDVLSCNGIIHAIDAVLLPPADDAVTTAMPATGVDSGVLAIFAAGLMGIGSLGMIGARRRRTVRVESNS